MKMGTYLDSHLRSVFESEELVPGSHQSRALTNRTPYPDRTQARPLQASSPFCRSKQKRCGQCDLERQLREDQALSPRSRR